MARHAKKHKHQTVLALDSVFMPMVEMSRRKAMIALATGRAQALDLQTWGRLSLLDVACRPLYAIVFPHTKAPRDSKVALGRDNRKILRRDGHVCQYVGCSRKATTVDHVVPRCQGGQSTWTNLVACCFICNQLKGGRTPEQAGMVLKGVVRSPRAILMDKLTQLTSA